MDLQRVACPTQLDRRPAHERCREFLLTEIEPGMRVLDVGCGTGDLMLALRDRGCDVQGIEIEPRLVDACRARGLDVHHGRAEQLPLSAESIDAIVCSVVLPYTDERAAIAEWARVLRPGGIVNVTCHGLGYGLDYLLRKRPWRYRFYGFRMLVNTLGYGAVRRRLPHFLGDTLCQSRGRLLTFYRRYGFSLHAEQLVETWLKLPIFICQRIVREPMTGQSAVAASPSSPSACTPGIRPGRK